MIVRKPTVRRSLKGRQAIGDGIKVGLLANKNMPHGLQPCRLIQRPGHNPRRILVMRLPEQVRSAIPAKPTPRARRRRVPRQTRIIGDPDISFRRFRVRPEGTMQALAHGTMAIDHIAQATGDFISHRTGSRPCECSFPGS